MIIYNFSKVLSEEGGYISLIEYQSFISAKVVEIEYTSSTFETVANVIIP